MRCTLVLPLAKNLNNLKAPFIGIDYGAYVLVKNELDVMLAVGDFDSCNQEELSIIKEKSKKVIVLSPEKDDTDTLYAIKYLAKIGFDEFHVVGGVGGRIDHTIANILMLQNSKFKIVLEDENYCIQTVDNTLLLRNNFKYISIFPLEDSIVTLKGFKYPLDNHFLIKHDILGTSNEIIGDTALIEVKGKLLVIQTNE